MLCCHCHPHCSCCCPCHFCHVVIVCNVNMMFGTLHAPSSTSMLFPPSSQPHHCCHPHHPWHSQCHPWASTVPHVHPLVFTLPPYPTCMCMDAPSLMCMTPPHFIQCTYTHMHSPSLSFLLFLCTTTWMSKILHLWCMQPLLPTYTLTSPPHPMHTCTS